MSTTPWYAPKRHRLVRSSCCQGTEAYCSVHYSTDPTVVRRTGQTWMWGIRSPEPHRTLPLDLYGDRRRKLSQWRRSLSVSSG